jgi:hypothetical protein
VSQTAPLFDTCIGLSGWNFSFFFLILFAFSKKSSVVISILFLYPGSVATHMVIAER